MLVSDMVKDGDEHDRLSDGAMSEVLHACRCYRTCNDYVHSDDKKLLLASFLCRETEGVGWDLFLLCSWGVCK